MFLSWTRHRANRKGRLAISAACTSCPCGIESLEARQLMSAVSTFPVPGADPTTWNGTSSHIVVGPDGNEWFTDPTDNAIGKVTPAGQVTMFPLPTAVVADVAGSDNPTPSGPAPADIVVGPDHNLWFTENGADGIGRITPDGVITEFHTPTANSNPLGLAVGADGNLWFAESGNSAIGRVTPDGVITEFPAAGLDVSYLDGIAQGADGNVWFIAYDSNSNGTLASITPDGKVTTYPLGDDPTALAAGPDGNLWVGTDSGNIDRVATDGTVTSFALADGAGITTITAGTDGNLWFTLNGSDQFGKISTAGVSSEFNLPAAGADAANGTISMSDIAQSSDGSIWFVDGVNPQVGTFDATSALLASGQDATVTAGANVTTPIGSFVDFAGAGTASDYTATLTLDSGATLAGTITANDSGGFTISTTSDWTVGYYNVSITVTDARDASRVATADSTVTVNAPQSVGVGVDISATSGQTFNGTVATFTNVDLTSPGTYSAQIDWGDGHTTAGTIAANSQGGFDVSGTNTYAAAGSFAISTTLFPYPTYPGGLVFYGGGTNNGGGVPPVTLGAAVAQTPPLNAINAIGHYRGPILPGTGGTSATATSNATVAPGVMDGTGYSVLASSTSPFSGDVASFTLADPSADVGHFHATVQWSDPGVRDWYTNSIADSDATISSDGQGNLTVSTTANFTQSGLSHFIVKITDDRLAGSAAVVGVAYGQVIVDHEYPVFWWYADGTTPVNGIYPPVAPGGNTTGGTVDPNPVLSEHVVTHAQTPTAFAGQTFNGDVGVLSGVVSGAAHLADLHGTIHWGDGATSAATFVGGNKGVVAIHGSHAYAAAGNYDVTVNVTQTLYSNGKASSLYPLSIPTVHSTATIKAIPATAHAYPAGLPIAAKVNQIFTGPVAKASPPATPADDTRSATIWWGDGTKTAGVITPTHSGLTVTGSHAFKKPGTYTVWIDVLQTAPGLKHAKITSVLEHLKTTAIVTG